MSARPVLVMLVCAVAAAAVSAQSTYPPPYPREGITLAFENARVYVWTGVAGIKDRPTEMHRHVYDLAGVFLDDGGMQKNTGPDGSITRSTTPTHRGDAVFRRKGATHIEEWLQDGIRVVAVELKDVASQPAPAGAPSLSVSFPREGATMRQESDRVVLWEYQWQPGRKVPLHVQNRDAVIVPLESGRLQLTPEHGQPRTVTLTFGGAAFIARGESFSEEATEGAPKAIVIELK
jgi:hypothetical protein